MEKSDNELIAEFMGATLDRATSNGKRLWSLNSLPDFCKQIDVPESRIRVFYADDLEFNTSWDWLMPVINKTKFNVSGWGIKKINEYLKLRAKIFYPITKEDGTTDIKACHKAVVDLIKWYNQQTLNA